MARTELPNGVILPAEYSDDWYEDMTSNLTKLDDVIGSDSEKLNSNDVAFLRMSSAALTDGGTGNFSDLNSSNKLKTGDYVLDSGRKLYQVVSVDSTNETFTVGNSLFKITAESDLAPVAESGDYDDLDNKPDLNPYDQHLANTDIHVTAADKQKWNDNVNQAYVVRYASTSVTPSSTISYSVLNNTDNIKAGDSVIDASGQVFLIASVDSANQTVTVSAVLLTLALDANVMHLSGNETVAGIKTFSDIPIFATFDGIRFRCAHNPNAYVTFRKATQANPGSIILSANDGNVSTSIHLVDKSLIPYINNDMVLGSSARLWSDFYTYHGYFRGQQQNDEYSGNARTNLTLLANRDTLGQSGCLVDTFRENTAQGTGSHIIGFGIKENSIRYEGCRFSWLYDDNNNGYVFSLRPTTQGTNQPIKYDLGTSAAKWSTFNGINPGALSFPDLNNGLDISGYITNFSGSVNEYTPVSDGWISIASSADSPVFIRVYNDYGFEQVVYSERNELGTTSVGTYSRFGSIMIPCVKDVKIYIIVSPASSVLVSAKFYPCLGNV